MSQDPVDPNTHTETPLSDDVPVYAPTGAEDDDLRADGEGDPDADAPADGADDTDA